MANTTKTAEDDRIIAALKKGGRLSTAECARELAVSSPAVKARLIRLTSAGRVEKVSLANGQIVGWTIPSETAQ